MRKLTIPKRFALSGTPVENKLEELWSIFQVIIPGFFPSKAKFKKFPTELIAQMIQPFVLRRTKEEVLLDLPERIETNYFNELNKEQKEIYLAQLEQIQKTLAQMNSDEFKKNRISILVGLTRLRQICCSPQLYLDDFHGESGKLEQLKELLTQALENNRRILIFSQFASMLNLIEAELAQLDIPCFKLDGSTPSKQRMEMVEAFNQGDKPVFLISLKAGGTGLNLTGANTVILYDLWWNPAVEDQATSRAHRMGQKEVVEVWRLITEGTIEEKIYELQQSKRELFDQVMQGDESSLSQLTEEDIRQIFQVGIE
ncbi:DEAD/DEAH box helicase [Enterococcus cecorum]